MAAPQTSIIIPCYLATPYHYQMTVDCLSSLKFGRPDQVILVDDGSPEDASPLKKMVDVLIMKGQNDGFPKTVNRGLLEAEGDVIIISNNDIIFNPGWLEAILKPLGEGYDISSIRTSDQNTWTTEDKVTEGDKFGSLWAMNRRVYDRLGGFDERYGRGYFEDLDYRKQAMEAGFKIAKNHNGFVEHIGKATYSLLDPTDSLYEKNFYVFMDKWGDKVKVNSMGEIE